jgi:hypothetical protein
VDRARDRDDVVDVRRERLEARGGVDVVALAVPAQIDGGDGSLAREAELSTPDGVVAAAPVDTEQPGAVGVAAAGAVRRRPSVVGEPVHTEPPARGEIKPPSCRVGHRP